MTIEAEPDFTLTYAEKNSALAHKLNGYLADQLRAERERNDAIGNDEHKTAVIRGHIEFLKRFLAFLNEPPPTDG